MKDYYLILGVHRGAHLQDIKRAYRRLAVQYHPDKNPLPEAEALFKEINEAYDILGDPEKRSFYDLKLDDPYATEGPRHRDPAYHRRRHAAPARKSEYQMRLELMAKFVPYCKTLIHLSFMFCVVLVADFLIPYKESKSTVKANYFIIRRQRESSGHILMANGFRVRISEDDAHKFKEGAAITLSFTRIFNIRTQAENHTGFISRLPVSIYGNFAFAPIALMIFSMAGLFARTVERVFNLAVVNFIILILCGIFLLMS
jgi:DnaJ-domain-containing protein 1